MRKVLVFLSIVISLTGLTSTESTLALAQSRSSTNKQVAQLPNSKGRFRPRLGLQQALKLAESYIEREKINIELYYLSEARIIQYGSQKELKEQRWYF